MAPEYPPSLVIFNARFEQGTLKGKLQYVEATKPGETLRVRWAVGHHALPGFRAVGDGVAFVYSARARIDEIAISDDARPNDLGDSRYQWTEGMQFGIPWIMFVLVLPVDYTITNPIPNPAGTKVHDGRLALYWLPKGDDLGRIMIECTLQRSEVLLEEELRRINRSYLSLRPDLQLSEKIHEGHHSKSAFITSIRRTLSSRFSKGELRTLCQDTGLDHEDLPGESKSDLAREIVAYHDRRGSLPRLLSAITESRPDILIDDDIR